jgi:hypothetical protein
VVTQLEIEQYPEGLAFGRSIFAILLATAIISWKTTRSWFLIPFAALFPRFRSSERWQLVVTAHEFKTDVVDKRQAESAIDAIYTS